MIEIIFLDVDGCMTDGGLYHSNGGEEMKKFNVKDGFAIEQWSKHGKISAIITGKQSAIVEKRAKELGVKYVFQGVKDKFEVASKILEKEGLEFVNAAAIGDDYNDIKLLNSVAMSFKPADALECVKTDIKLSKNGGDGAIREMIEMLVDKNNMREIWMSRWL